MNSGEWNAFLQEMLDPLILTAVTCLTADWWITDILNLQSQNFHNSLGCDADLKDRTPKLKHATTTYKSYLGKWAETTTK